MEQDPAPNSPVVETSPVGSSSASPIVPPLAASPGDWHVAIHGQRQGPMAREALLAMMRSHQVPGDALVWAKGMAQWQAAACIPDFAEAMGVPLRMINAAPTSAGDDTIATIVPFRNSKALIGYYISIAALIPGVGLALGPVAVVLGVQGMRVVRANPAAHGTLHAIIAIVLGAILTLLNIAGLIAIIVMMVRH